MAEVKTFKVVSRMIYDFFHFTIKWVICFWFNVTKILDQLGELCIPFILTWIACFGLALGMIFDQILLPWPFLLFTVWVNFFTLRLVWACLATIFSSWFEYTKKKLETK